MLGCLSLLSFGQEEEQPSKSDKAFFFLTQLGIKKYSTTIRPHYFSVFANVSGQGSIFGFKLEYRLKRLEFGQLELSSELASINGDNGRFFSAGLNIVESEAYNHFGAGIGISVFETNETYVPLHFTAFYRMHNPTRRFNFKFGFKILPSSEIPVTFMPLASLGYAFGKR